MAKRHYIPITADVPGVNEGQRAFIRKVIRTALAAEGVDFPCEVDVCITSDQGIHEVNREMRGVELGVSPRGTLALLRASQAMALVEGREFVTPEDVKAVGVPVIAHRLAVSGMAGSSQAQRDAAESLLQSVPLPTEDWSK